MIRMLKIVLHHPTKLWAALLVLCAFYGYARVLVLQRCIGAMLYSIYRYPNNFPHGFFLPFFYVSVTVAFFAGIYHDFAMLHSGAWKYVLPMPLTVRGRLFRIVGVPVYAFAVGAAEAVQMFRNPSMKSDLSRLAEYLKVLQDESFLDEHKLRAMIVDIKWNAWLLKTSDPTVFSYVRLACEVLAALVVCFIYGIAMFSREPRHDGEELREAARNNDLARVRAVLARGTNPNLRGNDGATALHICAQQAMVSLAKLLLDHKANPNTKDRLGFTPLHWAVQMRREEVSPTNRLEIVRLLLTHGGDVHQGDANGRSPLTIARKNENGPALDVLREVLGASAVLDEDQISTSTASTSSTVDGHELE